MVANRVEPTAANRCGTIRCSRPLHVWHTDGEAKFWIEPTIELFANYGLKPQRVTEAQKLVEEHIDAIRSAWTKHFPG